MKGIKDSTLRLAFSNSFAAIPRTSFNWITNRSCGALPIFALGEHVYRAALPNSSSCASVIFGGPTRTPSTRMVLSSVRERDRAPMGSIPETRPQLV